MANTRIRGRPDPALPRRLRPRKQPAQARSRSTVQAIVEAGSRILVEGGWEALTMQRLAEVAGVSPGSLYQYFPDKAAFVAHLIEGQSQRELAFHLARIAALPAGAGLEATLAALVDSTLAFQRQEGPLMRATLSALQHLGRYPLLSQRVAEATRALRALLELHRDEVAVPDLDLAAHVLANAIHSLTHDGILPRPADLDDATLGRALTRLVLGYLRGPAPPREG